MSKIPYIAPPIMRKSMGWVQSEQAFSGWCKGRALLETGLQGPVYLATTLAQPAAQLDVYVLSSEPHTCSTAASVLKGHTLQSHCSSWLPKRPCLLPKQAKSAIDFCKPY